MADIFGKLTTNRITAGGHLGRGVDEIGGRQRWAAKAFLGRRCCLPAAPTAQYCVQRSGLNHPRLTGEPALAGCPFPASRATLSQGPCHRGGATASLQELQAGSRVGGHAGTSPRPPSGPEQPCPGKGPCPRVREGLPEVPAARWEAPDAGHKGLQISTESRVV